MGLNLILIHFDIKFKNKVKQPLKLVNIMKFAKFFALHFAHMNGMGLCFGLLHFGFICFADSLGG